MDERFRQEIITELRGISNKIGNMESRLISMEKQINLESGKKERLSMEEDKHML